MMNRLKPMNSASNGVVPAAASRPSRLIGAKHEAERRRIEPQLIGLRLQRRAGRRRKADRRRVAETARPQLAARRPAKQTPWASCDDRPSIASSCLRTRA